jgi:hypothetical protein
MGDNVKRGHRNTGPEEKDLGNDICSCLMVGFRFRSVECGSIITANGTTIKISADTYITVNTHISSCSDGFHIQLVFKFCIVIYYIISGECPCIISCVL